MNDTYWRYEDYLTASPVDEFDTPLGDSTVNVRLIGLRVVKRTPKGVRLDNGRFVLNDARKRYACETKELALESFLARKRKQLSIYSARIKTTNRAIEIALAGGRIPIFSWAVAA